MTESEAVEHLAKKLYESRPAHEGDRIWRSNGCEVRPWHEMARLAIETCRKMPELFDTAGGMVRPKFVSQTCFGEFCHCSAPADHKVEEAIPPDDPAPLRHPLTSYVCHGHFVRLMGPAADYRRERDREAGQG